MIPRFLLFAALFASVSIYAAEDIPERARVLELLAAGKSAEALVAAREWTTAHPDSPEALLLYATVQAAGGDVEGAVDSLDSAYFLTRDVSILIRKGEVYLDSGQYARAEKQYQDALRQHEASVPAHVGLARVLMERGRALEAGASLQAALAIEPKSVEALVALARLRMGDGRSADARDLLGQALQVKPDTAEAYLSLGHIAAESGDMTQARAHWQKFAALDPGSPAHWQLAHNLYPIASRPYGAMGYYPTFARDGQRVAFRGRGGTDAGALYASNVDDLTHFEKVYQGNGTVYSLDWSPDGSFILCRDYVQEQVEGKPQYTYRLLLVATKPGQAPGEAKKLYEGRYVGSPCWMPDSQSIVFDGYIPGKGRPLLRLPLTGGEPQVALMPLSEESFSGCLSLATAMPPTPGALPKLLIHRWHVPSREYQMVLVNPQDRKQDRVLVHSPQSLYYMSVSPDGRTLLYFRRVGTPPSWSLTALALDEDGPGRTLPFKTTMPMPPAMTADGKHLVLYDKSGLYITDLVGLR